MYKVLVVGLKGVDSGKTTLSLAFLSYMRDKGFKVCGFKPMAGNNIWYDYDMICRALSEGKLYGNDTRLLKASSYGDIEEELVNPVHRLWSEPSLIDSASGIPSFIFDRITFWSDKAQNILVENTNNCADIPPDSKRQILEKLYPNVAEIYQVGYLDGLNGLVQSYYDRAIGSAYKKIIEDHDAVVIEGYSDAALPWRGLNDLDLVVGVEPWQISVYDPNRYINAVKLSTPTYSKEVSTSRIKELMKPVNLIGYLPTRPEGRVDELKELIPSIMKSC